MTQPKLDENGITMYEKQFYAQILDECRNFWPSIKLHVANKTLLSYEKNYSQICIDSVSSLHFEASIAIGLKSGYSGCQLRFQESMHVESERKVKGVCVVNERSNDQMPDGSGNRLRTCDRIESLADIEVLLWEMLIPGQEALIYVCRFSLIFSFPTFLNGLFQPNSLRFLLYLAPTGTKVENIVAWFLSPRIVKCSSQILILLKGSACPIQNLHWHWIFILDHSIFFLSFLKKIIQLVLGVKV